MKNLLLVLVSVTLFTTTSFSQWVTNVVDNGFDSKYTIAYTEDGQSEYLKMENYNGIVLYLSNTYICSDAVTVDILFLVKNEYKKYKTNAKVSSNHKVVFFVDDLSADSLMLQDFKDATIVKLRVNDVICDSEVYEFSMKGSTAAYEAVLKQ
jgi:hypothetical protein